MALGLMIAPVPVFLLLGSGAPVQVDMRPMRLMFPLVVDDSLLVPAAGHEWRKNADSSEKNERKLLT